MDMGDTYSITHQGTRYEIGTYPAWDNGWAEGRIEINGEIARVVPSTWYPRAIPTPTPAADVLAELIAAEEIDARSLLCDLAELAGTAEWWMEQYKQEVA